MFTFCETNRVVSLYPINFFTKNNPSAKSKKTLLTNWPSSIGLFKYCLIASAQVKRRDK